MVSAIIVAAGSSRRMGFDKLFAPLAGKPVVYHAIKAFNDTPEIDEIIVAGHACGYVSHQLARAAGHDNCKHCIGASTR